MNEQLSPEEIVNDILSLSDKLFRTLLPSVPDELLSLEVTMPQLKIMLMLYVHGPLRMSSLAADLNVTLPTATSLADKLVERGYISRENQPDDRRVVMCKLTAEGQNAINGIWVSARERCRQILFNMELEKLRLCRDALADMLKTSADQITGLEDMVNIKK